MSSPHSVRCLARSLTASLTLSVRDARTVRQIEEQARIYAQNQKMGKGQNWKLLDPLPPPAAVPPASSYSAGSSSNHAGGYANDRNTGQASRQAPPPVRNQVPLGRSAPRSFCLAPSDSTRY